MDNEYQYYKLQNGEYIAKEDVDRAFEVIDKLRSNNAVIVTMSASDVILHGNKVKAVFAFWKKYDCSIVEAKAAIDFLRS